MTFDDCRFMESYFLNPEINKTTERSDFHKSSIFNLHFSF